jgi:hypothetical protein
MNSHQHAAIEQTRIAWHSHRFEHNCYGRDCTEDRKLYRAYQCAISGELAGPSPQTGRSWRPVPNAVTSNVRAGR